MIILSLPYPVSANAYWRSFVPRGSTRAIVTLSEEARKFKSLVRAECKRVGVTTPLAGRVAVGVRLYPARPQDWALRQRKHGHAWDDSVRCIDLDNANKVLLDAIKGIAIEDDCWVRQLVSERMQPDAGGARSIVFIKTIVAPITQPDLLEALV